MLWSRIDSIFRLPPSRTPYGTQALRHAHNQLLDQLTRDAPPALLQSLTKAIPLLLSPTVIVVLWVVLVHALFESPPHVFY
jgi:hypothetical protein